MQDYELQVGDLAHCDEAKGIDRPFIGKVVRCEGQTYDMEVVYIPGFDACECIVVAHSGSGGQNSFSTICQ